MKEQEPRVKALEDNKAPREVFLHAGPGVTPAEARAAYERNVGPIPPNAKVTTIIHTFCSRMSFFGDADIDNGKWPKDPYSAPMPDIPYPYDDTE